MKNRIVLISFLIYISIPTLAQNNTEEFSILFYNVENLFDAQNDPKTNDDEFTPSGDRYWNSKKLKTKLGNISKVILNSNGWDFPDIVALCEIENRDVLSLLCNSTALKSLEYKIIHKDSPDERGIDIGLLYRKKHFYPISYQYYPIHNRKGEVEKTREILYVSGIANNADTLHLFVNHWPSRYSGVLETQKDRNSAATLLKNKIAELNEKMQSPKIIVVGDFNDNPTDESIVNYLQAKMIDKTVASHEIYNLSFNWLGNKRGTIKYQSKWSVFDQVFVSGGLLKAAAGLCLHPDDTKIVDLPFLIEKDEKYGGVKPWRTYYGYKYMGGFSDHFPILVKLKID